MRGFSGIHVNLKLAALAAIGCACLGVSCLLLSRPSRGVVTKIDEARSQIPRVVYNLSVAGRENYFVGQQRLLVHNCSSPLALPAPAEVPRLPAPVELPRLPAPVRRGKTWELSHTMEYSNKEIRLTFRATRPDKYGNYPWKTKNIRLKNMTREQLMARLDEKGVTFHPHIKPPPSNTISLPGGVDIKLEFVDPAVYYREKYGHLLSGDRGIGAVSPELTRGPLGPLPASEPSWYPWVSRD